jgi:hypothetical protein
MLRDGNGFGADGDAFYEALIASHEGLSDEDSQALNARLVLLLANEIGDLPTLRAAIDAARASLGRDGDG